MSDIMHDVTVRGTAVRATRELKRDDLAGKTGTSQEGRDNWFNGFNTQLVASVWVGFDDDKSLGEGEEGSRTALPIWIHYMREMLRSLPPARMERPGGLIDLRVSPTTGLLADALDPNAMYETFMLQHQPGMAQGGDSMFAPGEAGTPVGTGGGSEPLF
jgi:penicillin-binding protein 1A